MADIVNLNQFRKIKARTEKSKTAADNRVKFGRTKADKNKDAAARAQRERELDGKEIIDKTED